MNQSLIDKVREFWDSRPCNVRHSPAPVGTAQYFREISVRRYFVEPHITDFADFQKWRDRKVLEVGCGIGTDTAQFARAGANVTAIDLSPNSLTIAKKRFGLENLHGEFIAANAEELSTVVPIKPYDLIYSFGVIHHTPHPEKVFQELKKYCHAETELRIMLYAKWSWKLAWIIAKFGQGRFWQWRRLLAQYSEAQERCPVTCAYSGRDIKNLFESNGFEVTSLKKDFIFPYDITAYRQYQYKKVWYFRYLPRFLFNLLQSFIGWHMLITAKPK